MLPPSSLLLLAAVLPPAAPIAIDDGNATEPCQWPTVVSYRAGEDKCSGLLIHPQVIVTAAHCIIETPAGGIRFGEHFQPAALIVDAERCGIHPEYAETRAPSSDLGWCVLTEPVEGIPPTPLLTECESSWARAGETAVVVGFGATQSDEAFGTKRYAFTVLDSDLRADGTVWVGDQEVNGCFGDSGGPAFIRSPSGTWHALGVLVFGPECGQGPVLYRSFIDRIAWLEAETGFDLSPCSNCGTIATDPLARGASWTDLCAGPQAEAPPCPEPTSDPDPSDPDPSDPDPSASEDESASCGCHHRSPDITPWFLLVLFSRPWRPRRAHLRR